MIEQTYTVPNRSETWDCSAKINSKNKRTEPILKVGLKNKLKSATWSNLPIHNVQRDLFGMDLNHLPKIHPVEIVTYEDVEEINPSILSKLQWCR